jgi:hypothetical protein
MVMIVEQSVEGKTGRGNRSARRKPAPGLFCPSQIPHDVITSRTRAAAVEASDQPPELQQVLQREEWCLLGCYAVWLL